MINVAILDDYQGVALAMADWQSLGDDVEVTVFRDHVDGIAALGHRLSSFDVICLMRERTPFPRELFELLPNLRLLVTTGLRNASVDEQAAVDHGVVYCGTGGSGGGTPELTWGLILAATRHIPEAVSTIRTGGWQETAMPGLELAGRTLGVMGLGRIGSTVARVGLAFGMEVIAWSQNLTEERTRNAGVRLVTKEELFAQADVLTIHYVLSSRSRGLVGAADLARMKPGAYLVNTSRGPIVDEPALIDVLRRRRIAGAALDVFDREPLPINHPLRTLENVVLTPHIGYVTETAYRVFYGHTVEAIRAWLAGETVPRIITPRP